LDKILKKDTDMPEIMNEKYIELLKRQLSELLNMEENSVKPSEYTSGVDMWKSSTIGILERIFGSDSRKIKDIENIQYEKNPHYGSESETYNKGAVKEAGTAILNSCISELKLLGSPNPDSNNEGTVDDQTTIKNQENKQIIKLDIILNELRKELTGSQFDDITSIIESKENSDIKKNKISQQFKEFGINPLSNIIAGILTNPSIIG